MCKIDAREGTGSLVTIGGAVLEIYRKVWRVLKILPPARARVKKCWEIFTDFQTGMDFFYVVSVQGYKCILSTFPLCWRTQHVNTALLLSEPQIPIVAKTEVKLHYKHMANLSCVLH